MRNRWFCAPTFAPILAFCAVLLALAADRSAHAQGVDMSGQQITLAVGAAPGGGYDFFARLAARHLGNFIPGHPSVVVTNMPGAGGIIEINWLANVAPKDGTALGIVALSAAFEPLFENKQAQYDPRRLSWLGSLANYTGTVVVDGSGPFKTAQAMLDDEIVIGGAGTGSDITIWPLLMRSLVDARIRLVKGYNGTSGVLLAMERGEVQGMVGADWGGLRSSKAQQLREGKIRVIAQIASARHPELKEAPNILELAKAQEARQVLDLFIARQEFSRPFAAPPGVPAPVLATLREAFRKLAADPAFLQDAERARATIAFTSGEEVGALPTRVYGFPPKVIERATAELRRASQ